MKGKIYNHTKKKEQRNGNKNLERIRIKRWKRQIVEMNLPSRYKELREDM